MKDEGVGKSLRHRLLAISITAVVMSAVFIAIGLFFHHEGLDRADKYASIFGIFLSIIGITLTIASERESLTSTQQMSPRLTQTVEKNAVKKGVFKGIDRIYIGDNNTYNERIDRTRN